MILPLTIIIMGSCVNNYKNSIKSNLSILFTCCYYNDKVSFYIDGFEIFKNLELVSDEVLSITPVYVLYSNDSLITVYKNSAIVSQKKLELNNKFIDLTIGINGERFIEKVNLSNGRHIDIDGFGPENKPVIKQFKKSRIYD